MQYDVAGLGTILVDQQVVLPGYPLEDTKTEMLSHRLQVGGPVPTGLVLLSRFGKRCIFVGKWAQDAFGEFIQRDLRHENVNIDHAIQERSGSSGFAHVWIDATKGTRTIAYTRGEFDVISPAAIDASCFSRCRLLYLDGWSSGAAVVAAKAVRKSGGRVFLDSGSPKPGLEQLIPLVDVMNCPEGFAREYIQLDDVDEAARRLLAMGVKTVVFTRGERGAVLHNLNERIVQPAFSVSAVDTTGAGDVFSGGLIYGLLEEWPLDKTVKFASAAAALKCRSMGNRDALPSLDQVLKMVSSGSTE